MTRHRNNPRRQITLRPELNEALEELREKTGLSVSGFINDTMMGTIPHIKAIIRAYESLEENNQAATDVMSESLQAALQELTRVSLDFDSKVKILPAKGPKKS